MEKDKGNDQSGQMMKNTGAQQGNDNGYSRRLFPPGYLFSPTDLELVIHYLTRKVDNLSLPLPPIRDVNIYECNPAELPAKFKLIQETEWYFFTPRQKRYLNGGRPNRDAKGGHWKPSAAEKEVFDVRDNTVGYKRKLVFYEGFDRSSKSTSQKTDWHMHEYRLGKDSSTSNQTTGTSDNIMKLDDCVLVKIYQKKRKTIDGENNGIAAEEVGQESHDQDQGHVPPPPIPGFGGGQNQVHSLLPSLTPIQEMEPLPGQQFHVPELPPFPSAIQATIPLSGQHFLGLELPPLPEVQFFYDTGFYGAPNYALSNHLVPNSLDNQMVAPLGRPPAFGLNDHAIAAPDLLCYGSFVTDDSQLQQIGGNLASNSLDNQMVPVPGPLPELLLNDQATAAPDQLGTPNYALSNYLVPNSLDSQMVPLPPAYGLNDYATSVAPNQFGDGHFDYSQFQQIGGADGTISMQIGGAPTNALYNLASYLLDNQMFPPPGLLPALELDDQMTAALNQLGDGVPKSIK